MTRFQNTCSDQGSKKFRITLAPHASYYEWVSLSSEDTSVLILLTRMMIGPGHGDIVPWGVTYSLFMVFGKDIASEIQRRKVYKEMHTSYALTSKLWDLPSSPGARLMFGSVKICRMICLGNTNESSALKSTINTQATTHLRNRLRSEGHAGTVVEAGALKLVALRGPARVDALRVREFGRLSIIIVNSDVRAKTKNVTNV